jgi:hypothetical protein
LFASGLGYGAYQSHVSSDLKRIVASALDPSVTKTDVSSYLRDSLAIVRTRKDREVVSQLERIEALKAEDCETEDAEARTASGGSLDKYAACLNKTNADHDEAERMTVKLASLVSP